VGQRGESICKGETVVVSLVPCATTTSLALLPLILLTGCLGLEGWFRWAKIRVASSPHGLSPSYALQTFAGTQFLMNVC
jgi:hypothetical protein